LHASADRYTDDCHYMGGCRGLGYARQFGGLGHASAPLNRHEYREMLDLQPRVEGAKRMMSATHRSSKYKAFHK
ncbi:MAG: hypothetical protein ACREUU_12055, partial [Gammaproteobacteria bacterium]